MPKTEKQTPSCYGLTYIRPIRVASTCGTPAACDISIRQVIAHVTVSIQLISLFHVLISCRITVKLLRNYTIKICVFS